MDTIPNALDDGIIVTALLFKEKIPVRNKSGVAVTRPHGNHQDVGSNPATARNEKTHNGQTPAQRVPQ